MFGIDLSWCRQRLVSLIEAALLDPTVVVRLNVARLRKSTLYFRFGGGVIVAGLDILLTFLIGRR